MRWRVCLIMAGVGLGGCAGGPREVAVAPPPVAMPAPSAPTPINAGLGPEATLWHLRTGLNVAALACPGAGLVTGYNALLARRAAALRAAEAAYRAEYAGAGSDGRDRYDDDQTRLYNFWAQARGRAGLCAAAHASLSELEAADDGALPQVAAAQLAVLDRAFAPPRLEVDARVFNGPGRVMVASR